MLVCIFCVCFFFLFVYAVTNLDWIAGLDWLLHLVWCGLVCSLVICLALCTSAFLVFGRHR